MLCESLVELAVSLIQWLYHLPTRKIRFFPSPYTFGLEP